MLKNSGLLLGRLHLAPLLFAVVLSACSSNEDFSDRLRTQGSHFNEQADKWSEGEKMAKKGDALITEGRELAEEGHQKIAKGQKMAAEGRRIKQEVESAYNSQPSVKVN